MGQSDAEGPPAMSRTVRPIYTMLSSYLSQATLHSSQWPSTARKEAFRDNKSNPEHAVTSGIALLEWIQLEDAGEYLWLTGLMPLTLFLRMIDNKGVPSMHQEANEHDEKSDRMMVVQEKRGWRLLRLVA